MIIHHLIIHNVKRDDTGKFAPVKRQYEIKTGPKEMEFIEKLLEIYQHKSNPAYGVFDADATAYPYQIFIKDFLATKITFKRLSELAVDLLIEQLTNTKNATGGYFLVINYTKDRNDFMGIIMLNNTSSFDIDETKLEIVKTFILDIDKMDVANIVNLSKWKQKAKTYLTFTKGRKALSNYFLKFIGCTELNDSKYFSQNLKTAFNDFLIEKNLSEKERVALKMNAYGYFEEKTKAGKDITIKELANTVYKEDPGELIKFITKDGYEINPTIHCDISVFKDYQFIHFSRSDLSFKFHRSLLDNGTITYNKQKKAITIHSLDQSVIDQIEEA